ncbi:MAG: signal peptidase I [Lachnospiraceae bacterium]|nr:signal peptidase I [Lachnospiraceae bacterium]MCD7764940.1 signal peptidase I [Lachnospiraceae bacterium]
MSREKGQVTSADEEKKVDPKKEVLSWIFYIAFVVLATWLILHYVGQRTVVDGSSMNDTLIDGDNLIVEKLSYRFGDPERFDIIVFQPYEDSSEYYIKRIIGLPGETVRIDEDGNIYINGELLEEDYGKETIENPGRASEEITLGEDEYFVLGDNRNNSTDSRTERVGNVSRDSIVGKAWVRIWPLSSIGLLSHQ